MQSQPRTPDDPNADVILRSSDGVDFRVAKRILSHVSPVFTDLFARGFYLQQSTTLPTIILKESSGVLGVLLRLIYPGTAQENPVFRTFEEAQLFLSAIVRYQVVGSYKEQAWKLVNCQFLAEHPVSIYAIVCHYGWQNLVEVAAQETLKIRELALSVQHRKALRAFKATMGC
ncbi:hypothetical protein SCLCIDRAFT_921892 [Scleroderma citrinum Foug A]|uniref:BTB domain-containing protein n=1 Tax=Scleroderma citrinum Foug A TaxID=1036808 RepID=A0A0C3DK58_9AGAM|nr:hypothetical protein SCLCIDRAFT_921892 [Scleroderma citrinum Foug A]